MHLSEFLGPAPRDSVIDASISGSLIGGTPTNKSSIFGSLMNKPKNSTIMSPIDM